MADAPSAPKASARLDKWLWHARVTRTRTLARKLVEAGKVRLNRVKTVSPDQPIRIGDVLTITLPRAILVYEVAAFAERRGPYSQAVKLYVDRSALQTGAASGAGRNDGQPTIQGELAKPDARARRVARRLAGKPQ